MKEILEEIDKCKQDPYYFYLKYYKIETASNGKLVYKSPRDTEVSRAIFKRVL